jgi:hypothetical protein
MMWGYVTKTRSELTEARKGDSSTFSSMAVLLRVLIYVWVCGYVYLCCVYVSWIDEKSVRSSPEQSSSESRVAPPFLPLPLRAPLARTPLRLQGLETNSVSKAEGNAKSVCVGVCGCGGVCVVCVCFVCVCLQYVCVQYTHTHTHNLTG